MTELDRYQSAVETIAGAGSSVDAALLFESDTVAAAAAGTLWAFSAGYAFAERVGAAWTAPAGGALLVAASDEEMAWAVARSVDTMNPRVREHLKSGALAAAATHTGMREGDERGARPTCKIAAPVCVLLGSA